jgi:hypothetical protein
MRNRMANMPSIAATAIQWNETLSLKNNHVRAIVPLALAINEGIIIRRNLIGEEEMIR